MLGDGRSSGEGICKACGREKSGVRKGARVGGLGGGYVEKIHICINPDCPESGKNQKEEKE